MVALLQMFFPKGIFLKIFEFWLKFHWSLFPIGIIDSKSILVQVMAWHHVGTKPLSEPMITQFTDAYASPGLSVLNLVAPTTQFLLG